MLPGIIAILALLVAYPTLAPHELMLEFPLKLPAVDEHTIMEKKKKKRRKNNKKAR